MTQEERQLLLKDICARLPYGVICDMWFEGNESDKITEVLKCGGLMRLMNSEFNFIAKPYLRPLSSMTEKEANEWHETTFGQRWITFDNVERCADWLVAHHFDYRGLIPMGLALESPEDMYKTE